MARHWTKEEELYLENRWGNVNFQSLIIATGRSKESIRKKVGRMKLGPAHESMPGVTLARLSEIVGFSLKVIKNWMNSHDLPAVKKKVTPERSFYYIREEDFWEWAESHRNLLSFSRIEPYSLGKEPEWVANQREIDSMDLVKVKSSNWTDEEKLILRSMVNANRYTYKDISGRLNRSENSIRRMLYQMEIKARPLPIAEKAPWTKKDEDYIVEKFTGGMPLNVIAENLNRTTSSIRAKFERMGYGFEMRQLVNKNDTTGGNGNDN